MSSPENSLWRTVLPICWKLDPASARVRLVPPAPKSHNATTPCLGNPGRAFSAVERRRGIGDQRRRPTVGRQVRLSEQLLAQRGNLVFRPVGGNGDGDRRPVADGARHRFQGLDGQRLAQVFRAVGRNQRCRIADPLDESAQHQPRFGQVRVFLGQTDFGLPVLEQRQHGCAGNRDAARAGRDQVGHPDRQPERLAHIHTPVFIVLLAVAAVPTLAVAGATGPGHRPGGKLMTVGICGNVICDGSLGSTPGPGELARVVVGMLVVVSVGRGGSSSGPLWWWLSSSWLWWWWS